MYQFPEPFNEELKLLTAINKQTATARDTNPQPVYQILISLPSNVKNCFIHSGCPGQATAVTNLPSV